MINIATTAARMATSSPISGDKNAERRSRVHLGPLPSGFLQPTPQTMTAEEQREAADRQAAVALQRQYCETPLPQAGQITGRLSITIAQAKLVKNYGMTRMDPYVRLRVGHCIYETHTDPNGGKTPRWNKVIHCLLPSGVNSIYLEIFDECSFTMDELIAWTHITIPQPVLQGETHEDWYPLNGKQGDGMEGMINLVLSYGTDAAQTFSLVTGSSFHPNHSSVYGRDDSWYELWPSWRGFGMYRSRVHVPRLSFMTAPIQMSYAPAVAYPPVVMVPNTAMGFAPMTVYPAQPTQAPAPPVPAPVLSEEELKQIEEMFPSIDKEVIKTVFEANRGNKDGTINSLLQMSE